MAELKVEQLLGVFKLNDKQHIAAIERKRNIVVTAGAGSGKTRTLVARYVCLLAEGTPPRHIAAITFTKKAAREMRSRVREHLNEFQQLAGNEDDRQSWLNLSAQMDSARIGTIHSLCTEILRAHPAEAGIDPRFEVLDESLTAALRIQAVDETLKALVSQEQFLPLLENIPITRLTEILQDLLNRRLEAVETFESMVDNRTQTAHELTRRMEHPQLVNLIKELRIMPEEGLLVDAGENLALMIKELLVLWGQAEEALATGDPVQCAALLYQARRTHMRKGIGKKTSSAKEIIAELQEAYDTWLQPLAGGKNASDPGPAREAEALFEQLLPLLCQAFDQVHKSYKSLLNSRQALDFDDLEYGAQQLMRREDVRAKWQLELDAVLVDEFQDTNPRQREIVEALAGGPGHLFIVGDMRQSIYRFRRADVTVFKDVQERIKLEGGLLIDLDETYRAHEPLLMATGDLLVEVIGSEPIPEKKYYIPFTPLVAHKKDLPAEIKPPHVEFVFGAGEDAETARPLAARALAARLLELKAEKQINNWDEVALLFRASTGFPVYEEALEQAGIPFVTVAGRGFYDRPEIRDVVNILRALADPLDDLAFAGLLRSPAFGLSDAALFILRQSSQSYWSALRGDLSSLNVTDRERAERALLIFSNLQVLVDRIPVAELLKQIVDAVDYRAMLATADEEGESQDASAAGGRLWRNLDKLIEDAQVSQQMSVSDFLDLLKVLNDAGAREGEAPAEADGTVRLMTIHKSKGLEFNIVVLADSSREVRAPSEQVYLSDDIGVTFKLDPAPMLYNLAKEVDKDQNDMEALRLIYVALTRAKSKLIISGHTKLSEEGVPKFRAWSERLVNATGSLMAGFQSAEGRPFECFTQTGQPLRGWCVLSDFPITLTGKKDAKEQHLLHEGQLPLYQSVMYKDEIDKKEEEQFAQTQVGYTPQKHSGIPGNILGSLVHKAIQHWLFPGDPSLVSMIDAELFNAGITNETTRQDALDRACRLLDRLRQHPLWEEINSAQERHSEIPYTCVVDGRTENRVIDLLYRNSNGWRIIDFKTDPIEGSSREEELIKVYTPQVHQYQNAVITLLGEPVEAQICLLDDHEQISLVDIGPI